MGCSVPSKTALWKETLSSSEPCSSRPWVGQPGVPSVAKERVAQAGVSRMGASPWQARNRPRQAPRHSGNRRRLGRGGMGLSPVDGDVHFNRRATPAAWGGGSFRAHMGKGCGQVLPTPANLAVLPVLLGRGAQAQADQGLAQGALHGLAVGALAADLRLEPASSPDAGLAWILGG